MIGEDNETSNMMKNLRNDLEVKKRDLQRYKDNSSQLINLTENIQQYRYLLQQIAALRKLRNKNTNIFQEPVVEVLNAGHVLLNRLITHSFTTHPGLGYDIKSNGKDIKMVADTFRYIHQAIADPFNTHHHSALLSHNNKLLIKAKNDDLWKRFTYWALYAAAVLISLTIIFTTLPSIAGIFLAPIVAAPLMVGAEMAEYSRLKITNKPKYNFLNQLHSLNKEIAEKIPETASRPRI